MSGSDEERTPAADEIGAAAEPAVAGSDEPAVEMSAAEALARVTEAAAEPADRASESAPAEPSGGDVDGAAAEAPAASEETPPASEPEKAVTEDATAEDTGKEEPETVVSEAVPGEVPETAAAEPAEEAATEPPSEGEPEAAAIDPAVEDAEEGGATEAAPERAAEVAATGPVPEAASEKAATEPLPEGEPEVAPTETVSEDATERNAAEEAADSAEDAAAEAVPEEPSEIAAAEPGAATEAAPAAVPGAAEATAPKKKKKKKRKRAPAKPQTPPPDRPELRPVIEAMEARQPLEGRVIGWNDGGFHLALGDLSAFCPRSEMEIGEIQEPESYLDRTFEFRVLRLQGRARRIVVSRAAQLRNEKSRQRNALRKKLQPGTELDGTVASLKDFGAFVDLGGAQGLVHVSEISHRRVEHPSHVLSEGQEVRVKVLKVEQGGRRISLSIRALEPDPWKDLADRFPRGAVVKGTVEKANQIGAFIELAPGLTGLLPARSMSIPRETSPARAYPPGKEISVQIVSVDPRRQRISLALEGSGLEGSQTDYKEFQRQRRKEEGEGFNALASAFRRLQDDDE